MYNFKKSLLVGGMISVVLGTLLYGAIHILPEEIFAGGNHHGGETETKEH